LNEKKLKSLSFHLKLALLPLEHLVRMSLTELVLTSTPSSSPLPLTSLHNPITGQLVYSFKSPPQPNTTVSNSNGKGKEPELTHGGETMSYVEGGNGISSVLFGLGGKDGRAILNVWNLTRVRLLLLFIVKEYES